MTAPEGILTDQNHSADNFGLIDPFGTSRKDPFRKFYDRATDDYIFKL